MTALPMLENQTMRFAFYGRVSTEDAQDPSLSIPRQIAACERAIQPVQGQLVALYWDIESGRKALAERGNGADSDRFGLTLPRAGGLPDLLSAAKSGSLFDAVIVESIDRLSRMTVDATSIERDLERRDIGLFASDEPMSANATAILTRRVKQGVAEWYVRDLIEKSRRGMEESVRQGWHTGGPVPYGYMLEAHTHPNPHKAREGRKKHRLIPDPVRGPIVRLIFELYCERQLGLGAICDLLNADLDHYPPPQRNKKDENELPQTWSRSQVQAMLRNPKYTGFNVWGRHDKRRGRPFIRPRSQWVWSATPTHEALVSRELFDKVEQQSGRNNNPLKVVGPLRYPTRQTGRMGRTYPLRGRVRCGLCGRRMEGSHQRGSNWYRCQYVSARGIAAADAAGHPRTLGVKEDHLLQAAVDFLGRRLFGPERIALLRQELTVASTGDTSNEARERVQLSQRADELDRALYRQALRLEEHDDPNHPVVKLAVQRIEELTAQREAVQHRLSELEQAETAAPPKPAEIETLLDAVPDLRSTIGEAGPEDMQALLAALDFTVTYTKDPSTLVLTALLTPELVSYAEKALESRPEQLKELRTPVGDIFHSGGRI